MAAKRQQFAPAEIGLLPLQVDSDLRVREGDQGQLAAMADVEVQLSHSGAEPGLTLSPATQGDSRRRQVEVLAEYAAQSHTSLDKRTARLRTAKTFGACLLIRCQLERGGLHLLRRCLIQR